MKVDPKFIGTHSRLSWSVQLLHIAKNMMSDSRPQPKSLWDRLVPWKSTRQLSSARRNHSPLLRLPWAVLRIAWTTLPQRLRIAAYNTMQTVGVFLYGRSNSNSVQRLPFGLYLKFDREQDCLANEANALRMVGQFTSLPVPEPIDLILRSGDRYDPFSSPYSYLLTTRLPGLPLSDCHDVLSDKDLLEIAAQMKGYLAQIRHIPRQDDVSLAICNTLGKACHDSRIHHGEPVGPFADEAAFNRMVRFSDASCRLGHEIVFTHADLNPRNILVDLFQRPDGSYTWRVTGIVDWEFSGYYPEYWDYTKSMFEGFRWTRRYNNMMKAVFDHFRDYSQELDIEQQAWGLGDGI